MSLARPAGVHRAPKPPARTRASGRVRRFLRNRGLVLGQMEDLSLPLDSEPYGPECLICQGVTTGTPCCCTDYCGNTDECARRPE